MPGRADRAKRGSAMSEPTSTEYAEEGQPVTTPEPEIEAVEEAAVDDAAVEEAAVEAEAHDLADAADEYEAEVGNAAETPVVYTERPVQTVGRRKEAVVRVRLMPGTGKFTLNGKSLEIQHFDGLIDLGNTFGLRNLHDRKTVAHAWTVTYWGALLAMIVEFTAFAGLFLINPLFAFGAIIAAEVSAKESAMVTIVWAGKPTHKGLGSIFLAKAKKKLNIVAYLLSILIAYPFFALILNPFLGLISVAVISGPAFQ